MNIDYANLDADLESGAFRDRLRAELITGFRLLLDAGEPLPPPSHYAARISEIVDRGADAPIRKELQFYVYKEILLACEEAKTEVEGGTPATS
jgi:hypothetical protein